MVLAAPPFPVAGRATYTDDWLNARTTPCPHLHKGTDIFADFGTPIVASGPGTLTNLSRTGSGGNAIWVAGDDGNTFYYAHMLKFADGVQMGQRVEKGTVLGEVGDSGNAEGGAPHLHFQIHPPIRSRSKGIVQSGVSGTGNSRTPPANPVGYLNIMLEQSEANIQPLIDQLAKSQAPLLQLGKSGDLITLGQALPTSELRFGQPLEANPAVAKTAIALGVMALVTVLAAFVTSWRLLRSRSSSRKQSGPVRPLIERPSHQLI